MLEKIRKGTDNLLVRIILGIIALSFVGIGGASFIRGNSSGDIVSFSDVESISMEKFQMEKAREIDILQRQSGTNFTPENIAELGIDNSVLRRLINESMITYLSNYYDFDISDELVIKFVKKIPFFQNQNGEFDLSAFKAAFGNSPSKEDEYTKHIKKQLVTTTLLDVFMNSFQTPKMMTENMVNYMAETRVVDLLSVDLSYRPQNYKPESLSTEELESFYQDNQTLFIVPELRTFDYIKSDQKFLAQKLRISEGDLKKFFEENKEDFGGGDYTKVKKQVREALSRERLESLMSELAQNFEEDVSSGLNLQEIAKKYNLKVSSTKDISLLAMHSSSKAEYVELADNVFAMIEGEVSYPIEVADKNEILLVSLKSITDSRQKPFAEVKKDIKTLLERRALALFNAKNLEEIKKNYNPKKINKELLRSKGISVLSNKSFTRADLPSEDKLPIGLLQSIFSIKKNDFTTLVGGNNKVYMAYLRNVNNSKNKAKVIRKNSEKQFSNTIKDGLFQELIFHLTRKNNMKVMQGPTN